MSRSPSVSKLKYQFKWTWEDVLKKSIGVVNMPSRAACTSFIFLTTPRAPAKRTSRIYSPAWCRNASPIPWAWLTPWVASCRKRLKYMVRLVKSLTQLPVEVHTHNDFGMAVATELAGVEAGAEVVHSCANGLGERTGNAALEELIVALHVLYGYDTQYDLGKLPELGALVSRISQFDIALNKPILAIATSRANPASAWIWW